MNGVLDIFNGLRAKRAIAMLLTLMMLVSFTACGQTSGAQKSEPVTVSASEDTKDMVLMINGVAVSVEWEDNESVKALKNLVSKEQLTIQMSMYGSFEQVGSIGTSLPRNDVQTTTEAGDIVLYSGNQIVIFYGSNSWAYTGLGKVTDKSESEMAELLGKGNVTITIQVKDPEVVH